MPREFGLSRYHEYTLSYQNIQATPDIEIGEVKFAPTPVQVCTDNLFALQYEVFRREFWFVLDDAILVIVHSMLRLATVSVYT